jgi:Rps23 Pro-64 3,4-dihydroxylase Tpa1-like proline 4-hydroxylase
MIRKPQTDFSNLEISTWLNKEKVSASSIEAYRKALLVSCPNHIVIDHLFNEVELEAVTNALQQPNRWITQKHTYSALYVDDNQWQDTHKDERFVQRDVWNRDESTLPNSNTAHEFLSFLRGDEFMSVLSGIFNTSLTDLNVVAPEINTNYFRLGTTDFVEQHADDSPGREVCMLLYLNKDWKDHSKAGGELVFIGETEEPISIAPLFNRCVLFDPSSKGSEHWVKKLNSESPNQYRYNVTSWYWSE